MTAKRSIKLPLAPNQSPALSLRRSLNAYPLSSITNCLACHVRAALANGSSFTGSRARKNISQTTADRRQGQGQKRQTCKRRKEQPLQTRTQVARGIQF